MKQISIALLALAGLLTTSCSDASKCGSSSVCVEIPGGDTAALLDAVNSLGPDTTIVLGAGTYEMTNALTIRSPGAHIVGQGIDKTILSIGSAAAQSNGIDAISDGFLVQDLTVLDAKKDGIRVEDSTGVTFRRIRATWTNENLTTNGAYGIYPVHSQNVIVENSYAENASDAGLYVGQCQHVIVRNNTVRGNVAGLEIENTQYADVHHNLAEDNTAGIVVFDLPGNKVVGRDVSLHHNTIRNNNRTNFAVAGTTVASIPVGTGTFAMASRRVEIRNNTYIGNDTGDIALISGLVVTDGEPAPWVLNTSELVGDWEDLGLMAAGPGVVMNFRSENIVVRDNKHEGSGLHPDTHDPMMLGLLLLASFPGKAVSSVLYDTIGESMFSATDASANSNDNHICVGANTRGTFSSMNLAEQTGFPVKPFFTPDSPFSPFDCSEISIEAGGPINLPRF
jgi:parallel beta-helix repeat protein